MQKWNWNFSMLWCVFVTLSGKEVCLNAFVWSRLLFSSFIFTNFVKIIDFSHKKIENFVYTQSEPPLNTIKKSECKKTTKMRLEIILVWSL